MDGEVILILLLYFGGAIVSLVMGAVKQDDFYLVMGLLFTVAGIIVLVVSPTPTSGYETTECAKCACVSACEDQGMNYKDSGTKNGGEYCICKPTDEVRIY